MFKLGSKLLLIHIDIWALDIRDTFYDLQIQVGRNGESESNNGFVVLL